jgi:hypothetical protein
MVFANAAVAYGADMKSTVTNIKKDAAAAAADAKTDIKNAQKKVEGAAQEAQKKAEATPAPAAAPVASTSAPAVTADDAKKAASDAKTEGAEVSKATGASLIIPESAVLPEGVVRVRGVVGAARATTGFDRDSKSIDLGATLKATAGAGVLEFAITDKISGQILVPFRSAANFEVTNDAKFRDYVKQTSAYKDFYAQGAAFAKANLPTLISESAPVALLAAGARAQAIAAGASDAVADATAAAVKTQYKTAVTNAIAANQPLGTAVPLSAYGLGTIGATENVNDAIDRVLLDAGVATAKSKGIAKGIGDIEIGAKYALSTEKEPLIAGVPFFASVALGLRLNTSHFKTAAAENETATGRGTTDLGLRLNADYNLIEGLQLQVENQSEMMVQKGKTHKFAALGGFVKDYDTGKLYTTRTDVDYERTGMRQVGYAKFVLAPGAFSSSLNSLKVNAKYSYDFDAKVKVDGVEQKDDAARYTSVAFGLGLDGLQMGLPVQADVDYVMPVSGRNIGAANKTTVGTLKLYYKF